MKFKHTFPLMLLATLVSCKPEVESDLAQTEEEKISEAVEAAITSISGSMDEQSDEDFASYEPKPLLNLNLIDSAYAANCFGRAVGQVCDNGIKGIVYDDCTLGRSNHSLSGTVQLEYSDSSCSMADIGNTVQRTYDLTRTTPFGAQVNVTSNESTDYSGETYGGGALLTKTADSEYSLQILGKHKKRTRSNGKRGFDISIKTLADLEIEGGLRRANRRVKNGSLQISHNRLEYKSVITATELEYASDCCYPVGGTLTLEYSGSINGSGSVNFLSCGEAELVKADEVYPIEFYSCE